MKVHLSNNGANEFVSIAIKPLVKLLAANIPMLYSGNLRFYPPTANHSLHHTELLLSNLAIASCVMVVFPSKK